MIPDYCVPELAKTGSIAITVAIVAVVLVAIGVVLIVVKRRNKNSALAALVLVGALAFTGLGSQNAFAVDAPAGKDCPAGYRYDASRDKGNDVNKPAGYFRAAQPDDRGLQVKTDFTIKPDGSTGATAGPEDVPNWDIAKKTIRAYMGADHHGQVPAEKMNDTPYAKNVEAVLKAKLPKIVQACKDEKSKGKNPAAVFDTDDTTLFTYNMEDGDMHFAFSPKKQQDYFDKHNLPATPHMIDVVKQLHEAGCTIIGLTGRNSNQQAYTLKNLKEVGYVDGGKDLFTNELFFTKPADKNNIPSYLPESCKTHCGPTAFKAATRKYLEGDKAKNEGLGYTIVGNFGDQWSDLQGGHAQNWVKLPNATYYLPADPKVAESYADADKAANLDVPTEYNITGLAPDGSLGTKAGVTDQEIPNMDIVKATIRAFYNAKNKAKDPVDGTEHHIADPASSQYITDTESGLTKAQADVVAACAKYKDSANKPAIVLDADDTSLWMYDMEEWLDFNFSPALQTEYLKTHPRPLKAVPGMVKLTKAAAAAGCKVIGLTGRSDDLREVTLESLQKAGYTDFTKDLYFTKTSSMKSKLPSYIKCAKDKCTTIEFKSSVRRHIEEDLGYHIVGNFGDQYSDLIGGYTDANYKIPNPTYYLP